MNNGKYCGLRQGAVLLALFLILLQACQSPRPDDSTEASQPNFFIYLADDLSYNDLGITGNHFVKTPSVDRFAKDAIAFEKMYTPSAMCAPSRSAMLTGLYPHRNGCHMNHGSIKEDVQTLPTYLRAVGYSVALIGKRHIQPREAFPFDYIDYEDIDAYMDTVAQPVCMIYASNEPHGPHGFAVVSPDSVTLPAKWLDTPSTREKLSGYYADIRTMDDEFELFQNEIKKHKLDKEAITIFTSDHGFEYFAKWSCYEAGLRVPFFMQTSGIEFKVSSVSQMTNFVDIVPTLIELAGGLAPTDLDGRSLVPLLNGEDKIIHEYIYGAHTTRGIYSGLAYPVRSVTNGKWKYIHNLNHETKFQNILTNGWNFDPSPTSGGWAEWLAVSQAKGQGHEWTTMYQTRPSEELYNLDLDPDEVDNLATDVRYIDIKKKLSNQLNQWMIGQGDDGLASEILVPLKARDMAKVPTE